MPTKSRATSGPHGLGELGSTGGALSPAATGGSPSSFPDSFGGVDVSLTGEGLGSAGSPGALSCPDVPGRAIPCWIAAPCWTFAGAWVGWACVPEGMAGAFVTWAGGWYCGEMLRSGVSKRLDQGVAPPSRSSARTGLG